MKHNGNESVTINVLARAGTFAENKDTARDIRRDEILPALEKGKTVILDFSGVTSATQSFIHALISDVIRQRSINVLDRMLFKSCNSVVKNIVSIVTDYMQYEEEPTEPLES
jgi:hypothetical protein